MAAQEYVSSGVLEKQYHYFSSWYVDQNNPNALISKETLPSLVRKELEYSEYIPTYNDGARKIRTVSAKESNYFNILQSIAQTFEAWLDLEVERDLSTGAILKKKAKFKNYIGEDNYANFRYGVNL
jgi:hypothetical protein